MSHDDKPRRYWQHLDELGRTPSGPQPERDGDAPDGLGRRSFLQAVGFAVAGAALSGCAERTEVTAVPYLRQPVGTVPGKPAWFATLCPGCSAGCGVLAQCRDGRPLKLEGNPSHPTSRGGLCAVGQASLLGVYDSRRLAQPRLGGAETDWTAADAAVTERLAAANGRIAILTGTINSPTELVAINQFLAVHGGRHVVYDAVSLAAIREAHALTHGVRSIPGYRFDQAEIMVGVEADFLGTWLSPVEFTRQWAEARSLTGTPPRCARHVQLESGFTLTGGKADERLRLNPTELRAALLWLAANLARRAGLAAPATAPAAPPAERLEQLADDLWVHRGRALVLCGLNDLAAQVSVNLINESLDSYGSTVDWGRRSYQQCGDDAALADLLTAIDHAEIDVLLVARGNPLAEVPGADRLRGAPFVVAVGTHLDETAAAADLVVPECHPLETWRDAEAVNGVLSLGQPLLRPLGAARALTESLAVWTGTPRSAEEQVRACWERLLQARSRSSQTFDAAWPEAVRQGFVEVKPRPLRVAGFRPEAVTQLAAAGEPEPGMVLLAFASVGQFDGRHAENPWLHELPDPVSKATWDNLACLSPGDADRLGLRDGDLVTLTRAGAEVELPVLVQPGQADGVVAVAVGYGRLTSERFADFGPRWIHHRPSVNEQGRVGANITPLLELTDGLLSRNTTVEVTPTRRHRPLALAQTWAWLDVPAHLAPEGGTRRPMIEETTLAAYQADPAAGAHHAHVFSGELWPADHQFPKHHWAMVIDLQKCTGCSACVVACGIENNVPVVGRDEVRRHREMHWLRIDRYYTGEPDAPDVAHQPMMCHHCDNAPCEVVCPVLATVHSEEGLNQQVYNRCVGTRYCANNCPYKVRRFNWFDYPHPDPVENLRLNPDVTVRSRGVMEKCSFCVQRIEAAKIAARGEGRELADGEVQPACQQSCPAGAIVFGDLNDPESAISRLVADPRHYQLLTELNVKPSVGYLRLVRNRAGEGDGGHHG